MALRGRRSGEAVWFPKMRPAGLRSAVILETQVVHHLAISTAPADVGFATKLSTFWKFRCKNDRPPAVNPTAGKRQPNDVSRCRGSDSDQKALVKLCFGARLAYFCRVEGGTILSLNREGLLMSTLNPLKFVGGLVLEVGAVIAALAILPGLGGWVGGDSQRFSSTAAESIIPNQVYFDANSSRIIDEPTRTSRPTAWQNDYAPTPPVTQQRFVENTLDHSSQRALDAAARLWNQGDRLLPPDLRVRREVPNEQNEQVVDRSVEPLREYAPRETMQRQTMPREPMPRDLMPRTADYRLDEDYSKSSFTTPEYHRPSHYAQPSTRNEYTPRQHSAQEPRQRLFGQY